jgi:hypothetical protein
MSRILTFWNIIILTAVGAIGYYFYSNHQVLVADNEKLTRGLVQLENKWTQLRHQEGEAAYARQELVEVQKDLDSLRPEISDLDRAIAKKQDEIDHLKQVIKTRFLEYRAQMRKEAKGMTFDQITTPQGKVYSNIRIIEVRPDGISFRHGAAGSASARGLNLYELPAEWIKRFMYTEEELEWARSWTVADGTKTIYGKFMSYDEEAGVVTILEGARKLSFDFQELSEANQKWLSDRVATEKAEVLAIFEELDKQVIGSKIKKGVLSKLEGDHFFDFSMSSAPDYYVVYYSASW